MRRLLVAGAAFAALAGCAHAAPPDAGDAAADATPGDRLTPANQAALAELVATGPQALDSTHLTHELGGHDVWGPVAEDALDASTAAALEQNWDAAVRAAADLATPADAEAAGYQKAAAELPGIGAHYVNWTLVDEPFDAARPSMLLFDGAEGRETRLIGFSYWVRSEGSPPAGFPGTSDHWHMHHGYCFVHGFLVGEDRPDAASCPGEWLAGTDLWMAHAWVAAPNPWGRFAPRNPAACPGSNEQVADLLRCPSPLPTGGSADLDANALYCSLMPPTPDPPP